MAGYHNYSMSNNAVNAYNNGEKPLSKWTKTEIIEQINNLVRNDELILVCNLNKLSKLPATLMKSVCLMKTSWHHTSNRFNKTDFYSLDVEHLENLTDEEIDIAVKNFNELKKFKESQKDIQEKWECAFLEWSGSRKHPKATEVTEIGVIKGNWFYRTDGTKKSINATGFTKLRKIKD